MKYLLEKGAKLDVREEYNISPIFSAAHHGQPECLQLLLEEANRRGTVRFCVLYMALICLKKLYSHCTISTPVVTFYTVTFVA